VRAEPLTIFPVAHHSPSSAAHLARLLRERKPRVVFVELCEDLDRHLGDLADCKLPVALQAFASDPVGLPTDRAPLSVVAPVTESSAEFQAIAYGLTSDADIVFVDRSVDHVFQWSDLEQAAFDVDDDDSTVRMHGGAVGVRVGRLAPDFGIFHDALLTHANMASFHAWWRHYVEAPTLVADTDTYRDTFAFIGGLIRRLSTHPGRLEVDERRERFMWTRMNAWLRDHDVDPADAVFVCGAAHAATPVEAFGTVDHVPWEIPERSPTRWRYGLIPSSFGAIEAQFDQPRGSGSLARATWTETVRRWKLQPFVLGKQPKRIKTAVPLEDTGLPTLLSTPPPELDADEAQLIRWCSRIVKLARANRYVTSTADAIAIYETSCLLARMRGRSMPTPWDFIDAAETCLEKTRVPGRHSIRQLCGRLFGGDRIGQVGYAASPPLVQDVFDRLAPTGISSGTSRMTRVLLNMDADPDHRDISKLLWRLRALTPGTKVARPIMGQLALGYQPKQESWDVKITGAQQRELIVLAFEGVTVEQVLENRLVAEAHDPEAGTLEALAAAEQAELLLSSRELVERLGIRAAACMSDQPGVHDARGIFEIARRLVHHHRSQPAGLPAWLENLVTLGYQQYSAALPRAFGDRGTSPEALAGVLSFIFHLESLALTLGCDRDQLRVAVRLAAGEATDPEKLGLLWATERLVGSRDDASVADAFEDILERPLSRDAFPRYLAGFLHALSASARLAPLAVTLIGRALHTLPDRVVMAWLPGLITALAPLPAEVMPVLLEEIRHAMPVGLAALESATMPGSTKLVSRTAAPPTPKVDLSRRLAVLAHGAAVTAWSEALGFEGEVAVGDPPAAAEPLAVLAHDEALTAWSAALST
jgi:hypothetical protein